MTGSRNAAQSWRPPSPARRSSRRPRKHLHSPFGKERSAAACGWHQAGLAVARNVAMVREKPVRASLPPSVVSRRTRLRRDIGRFWPVWEGAVSVVEGVRIHHSQGR